jgi:hypothetical protein
VILSKQLILVPALNEEEGIGFTLAELRQVLGNLSALSWSTLVAVGSQSHTLNSANDHL